MPIVSAKSKNTTEPIPAGVHHAICFGVIELGTQEPTDPKYNKNKKIVIMWELPHETIDTPEGIKPRVISNDYTQSIDKKATLRGVLESWRGRAFTADELNRFALDNILGVNCQLNIVHKQGIADPSRTFARIQGVVPLVKGMAPLKPTNKIIKYDIPTSGPFEIPESIPEWIAEKIKNSDEYKAAHGAPAPVAAKSAPAPSLPDESVPF